MIKKVSTLLALLYFIEPAKPAKYDQLFEMEMAKAKQRYMERKKKQSFVSGNATIEELEKLSFKGTQIDSYVPLTFFFLKLYGDNFDYSLALHSC